MTSGSEQLVPFAPLAQLALRGAVPKLVGAAIDRLESRLKRVKVEISTPPAEIEKALSDHQTDLRKWAAEISFADSPAGRRLKDVFIPLDIFTPRKRNSPTKSRAVTVDLEDSLASHKQSWIVFGQPGAGKTTAVKHICERFFDDHKFLADFQLILRINLREVNVAPQTNAPEYLARIIQDLLHLRIAYPQELVGDQNVGARRVIRDQIVADWLSVSRALLILDGFDEITLKQRRDLIVEELRHFSEQLTDAAFILTTRTGEFSAHIEHTKSIEIQPFSQKQISRFASLWLGSGDGRRFISQLNKSPYRDTAIKPLTLAHLCVIFEKSKKIPSKPKTVYRKIVRLLLEDWDQEKSVIRESAYANFEADRKEEFLANLAYELTRLFKTTTFSRDRLIRCYKSIHGNFGLPESHAAKVVAELETHTGLFVQSDQENYEFSHKSLQEFLAAEFIVRLPSIPNNMIALQIMPNELAIATAISSQPSEYLTQLVVHHFSQIRTSFEFTRSFVNRLLLEDPEFEETPRVGYALIALYSQYLRAIMQHDQQLSLFVRDQLGKEFFALGQKIRQRVTLKELDSEFDRAKESYTFEGEVVWRLTRKVRKQARLGRADLSILPSEIFLRENLLAAQPGGARPM
ncbi:MAG TPA: NACHT domain-containing protein [Acidobacteriaceae bacterium]|jgi:hypothetical protein|nr:NACHT domain-containing protein [Acidobacteriaceae bacterium]